MGFTTTVSDIIRQNFDKEYWTVVANGMKPTDTKANHDLAREYYSNAFEDFPHRAKGFLGAGKTSMAIELEDGKVLKISRQPLEKDHGSRPFDIPVLEEMEIHSDIEDKGNVVYSGDVYWHIQPKVEMRATADDAFEFASRCRKIGFDFSDMGKRQIGYHNGNLVLIDYDAVEKRVQV